MNYLNPTSATLCLLLLFSACDRTPKIKAGTDTASNSRVEAQPFNGESYRTQDGRSAITLISSEELEYRVRDGTTLLCKYSSQQDAIRVILTALGTQQVLYFRRVPNGLTSNDGISYLSPSALAEVHRQQEELAKRAQQEAQAAEEQRRAAENARLAGEMALAREREEARKRREGLAVTARSTAAPLGQVECVDQSRDQTYRFVVTNVGVTRELLLVRKDSLRSKAWSKPTDEQSDVIWFDELAEKPGYFRGAASSWDREITLKSDRLGRVELYCAFDPVTNTAADYLEETFKLLGKAIDSWRSKYPALARW